MCGVNFMDFKSDQSTKINNENKLLILCARTRLTSSIKHEITQLIKNGLDWDYLMKTSSRHKLDPLIYSNLNSINSEYIELKVMDKFKALYNLNIHKNLLYLGELFAILKILKSENICAIPYKGPVLAATAYGNLGLREFVDIDIFVSKKDIIKTRQVLISNGYEINKQIKGFKEKIYINTQRDYQFYNPTNDINIEIHWNFIGMSFTYPSDLFSNPKNLKNIKINNRNVLSLSSEDMLIILCIHASGHLWERLSWICDISEFIQNEYINWQCLIEKCEKLGFKRILQINIKLAIDILGLKLSEQTINEIQMDNYQVKKICKDIKENLLNFPDKDNGIIYTSLMRKNIREKRTDQIQDFFKVIFSNLVFQLYSIF